MNMRTPGLSFMPCAELNTATGAHSARPIHDAKCLLGNLQMHPDGRVSPSLLRFGVRRERRSWHDCPLAKRC